MQKNTWTAKVFGELRAFYWGCLVKNTAQLPVREEKSVYAAKSDAEAKAKKALEKRKQLKVTSLKSYDLPIWLGLPHKFPDKWQDCHSYFEDAGIRLRFSMRQGEFEIGRSLIRKDENSQSNLLSFTQNAVQVQQNLLLWFSDCNKQADN